MKNKKNFIIILIFILIAIVIGIVGLLIKIQNINSNQIQEENNVVGSTEVVEKKVLEKVKIRNDYYTIKNIVDQYYYVLCELNKTKQDILVFEDEGSNTNFEEIVNSEKELAKKRLYDLFDKSYKQDTNLTIENIQEKLGNYKDVHVLIEDMFVRDITITLKLYFVSGTITEKGTSKKEKFELVVAVDSNNSTFNIYTSEYAEKYKFKDENKEFDISEIEKRTYNKYKRKTVNDEEYAKELLKSYTQSIMYNNIEYSYGKLNEEYKNKRFKEKTEYEKYIKEKKKNIISATLDYYKTNIYEGYIQYICVDHKENYYVFNEKAIMDYELLLDIYTVDLPEFNEKYEKASNEEKVVLNAQKIVEAFKGKDYRFLYTKLDDTFKKNKYPTIESLEKYLDINFSDNKLIEYDELIKEGQIYIYRSIIKNNTDNRNFDIIIKLKQDKDFVFSFNIE